MSRTKEWWGRLTKEERSELYWLERNQDSGGCYGGGGYLPDDCSECGHCGNPHLGGCGLCLQCLDRLIALHKKAAGRDGGER